jgi:putative ABC transport system permease protein
VITKLALRNIFRQKTRTLVTLAAISIGVVGLILSSGFVADIIFQLGEAIIHSQTGHIQIFRKNFLDKGTRQPANYLIEQHDLIAKDIASLPGVEIVTNRIAFAGLLNNGKRDVAIVGEGIEPDSEARMGTYLTLVSGKQLADTDTTGIMLGQGVAETLGVTPGDSLTLLLNTTDGALNTMDFLVTGIFQTFSKDFDARAVRIPLKAAQELLSVSGSNLLVVMLAQTDMTEASMAAAKQAISNRELDTRSWRQLSDFYDKSVEMYKRQFGVLRLIVLFMLLLSVANSVNMSLFERTREFGTLLALGNRPSNVFWLVMTEGALVGFIGATIGALLGCIMAYAVSAIGIPMPPPPNANVGYTAHITLFPTDVITAWLVGFGATTLATILPARRAANADVTEALRHGV